MNTKEKHNIPCTVSILTRNCADVLPRALESVKDFDEIIIIDGWSIDGTKEVAKKYGAKIIDQERSFLDNEGRIIDFSGVRNQALEAATYDWVFFLDSDELMTEELVREIGEIVRNDSFGAYFVPRKYLFNERIVECATTYPNKQMRFFHTSSVKSFEKKVHERIIVKENACVGTLAANMLVPVEADINVLREKWDRYISIEAKRRRSITYRAWLWIVLGLLKISLLYTARLPAVLLCRSRLPLLFEIERHRYHFRLARALFNNIQ